MRTVVHAVVAFAVAFAAVGGTPPRASAVASETPSPVAAMAPVAAPDAGVRTGRVVIGFDPALESEVVDVVERLGGTVERTSEGLSAVAIEPPAGDGAEQFAQVIADLPGIEYAEPEHGFTIASAPNDPEYPSQWGLPRIGLPAVRDTTIGVPSVRVAVIDTGLNFGHVDRPIHIDTANDRDFVDGDEVADDQNGHGTHVAGIIAAATNNAMGVAGVAPAITILPIRVLDARGNGDVLAVVDGIRHAADLGVDVINMSLTTDVDQTAVRDACAYARQRGCLIVAAAGNNGTTTVAYPARYPGVVAVGATTQADARAPFSQGGPDLDLVAPGQAIWSLGPQSNTVASRTGTSMAAPHVAGAAALVLSVVPTWTADMVAQSLASTADDLGGAGPDSEFGDGLVRADRAVTAAITATDDEIPGIPLPGPNFKGHVDAAADTDDVYSLRARAGDIIKAAITSSETAFTLRLFGPGQTSVSSKELATATTVSTSGGKMLEYTVPAGGSGTYYLNVRATSGAGEYTLTCAQHRKTQLTLTGPSTVGYKKSAKLVGELWNPGVGPVDGANVTIEAMPAGAKTWSIVGTVRTEPDGRWIKYVSPTRKTVYRAVFAGAPNALLGVASSWKSVTPRAYLTAPTAPNRVYKGRYFLAKGTLKPRPGSSSVKIKAYKYDASKKRYVLKKTYTAKLKKVSSTKTAYSARVRFTSRGRWKLVAYTKASVQNAATTSTGRYRTVKW